MGHKGFHKHDDVKVHDPYIPKKSWQEPTVCPSCSAVFISGRWQGTKKALQEAKKKGNIHNEKCPACRKIEDRYPLGIVNLSGTFLETHYNDIMSLIKSEERKAAKHSPLDRIIEIIENRGAISIHTTTVSLANRIGKAVNRAYKGKLEFKFGDNNKFIRLEWIRED